MPAWLKWTLIGCGSLVFVTVAGMVGCVVWLGSGPDSGVKLANEMDQYAVEYLDEHDLLEEGEVVKAYYDATISMDGTEAAILTDRRILYHRNNSTIEVALEDIVEVDHRNESLVGDVIEVVDNQGDALRIEIAPLNDGAAFLRALDRARVALEFPNRMRSRRSSTMSPERRFIVVAAVISDEQGRILLSRRPEGTHMAGLWEFPGGKVEAKETYHSALARELDEELGISVDIGQPLTFAVHAEIDLEILLLFFSATISGGIPTAREGQEMTWVPRNQLNLFPMPPADDVMVEMLTSGASE